ncbi:MAG: hypothetical protein ACR2PZ_14845 [Pseudomonadales bacterium]
MVAQQRASIRKRVRQWRSGVLLGLLTLLSGCLGAEIEVPTEFPVPLLDPLPVAVGLVLDEALTSYVHEEELPEAGKWRISIGGAQPTMFNNLFTGMFSRYQEVASVTAEDQSSDLQGVLHPSIAELQFSTPNQTRSDYFEVWIRYQIKLYDNGTLLGEWPITAYGKANVQNYGLSSTSPALQAAAFSACRDAMAYFAVEFQRIPAVKTWLDAKISGPNI